MTLISQPLQRYDFCFTKVSMLLFEKKHHYLPRTKLH